MPDLYAVIREPEGDESPHVGPFMSREEAEAWAEEQRAQGRTIHDIRRLDQPIGPPQ